MPNWCDNTLTMIGNNSDIEKIYDLVFTELDGELNGVHFDFRKIVPPPDHPDYKQEPIGPDSPEWNSEFNWYNWNISNWGTKWNANDTLITGKERNFLRVFFLTAWAPPVPVIRTLSKLFPDVKIKHQWRDDMGGDNGTIHFKGGELDYGDTE